MVVTKKNEIDALESLRKIVKSDSYLKELITPEMIDQMQSNIRNDFPITHELPIVSKVFYDSEISKYNLTIDSMQRLNDKVLNDCKLEVARINDNLESFRETAKCRFISILDNLINDGLFDFAYAHYDMIEVIKSKVRVRPDSLTDADKNVILSQIK